MDKEYQGRGLSAAIVGQMKAAVLEHGCTSLIAPEHAHRRRICAQWEQWTGVPMPGSGEYVIPGALQPVVVDRAQDTGVYEDPNVWTQHVIAAEGNPHADYG